MAEISNQTQKLINLYQIWQKSLQSKEDQKTIHVDEVAAKFAAFYEKLRGIIDWREEHLLKRGSIERIIKRRIFSLNLADEKAATESIAGPLVYDLIRSGHFPNDSIEENKIEDVKKVIFKYIFILNKAGLSASLPKSRIQLYNWLFSIAACEIEEILTPPRKERALIAYMYDLMKERIVLNDRILKAKMISEEEKNIQIYIAVQKALFKLDHSMISYHLIKYHHPDWMGPEENKLKELAANICQIWEKIEKEIDHPLSHKFYMLCEKYDTPYLLLGDVIAQDPRNIEEKCQNPETLEILVRRAYEQRQQTLKKRLNRAAVYVTLSIFISKILVALAIEIPFDKYITGQFSTLALLVNTLVPPLLMFLLVATIRLPKRENLEYVVVETMKIFYKRDKKDSYEIKFYPKRGLVFGAIITFFYFLIFCFFLSLIIWTLYKLNFPTLSYVVFIVFVSLIAFAGTKIRQRSKELQVIEEKEGFLHIIIDPFAIPFIQTGKWLVTHWQKYNVMSAIFNALIDMPFMIFVEFLEQWRYFLKEKKEKIH